MKIFVGCSSSSNIDEKYLKQNKQLLDIIFQENDLVFGACINGIMGLAYESALNHNKQIIGICPSAYKEDLKSLKCTKEIVTDSVSERTKKIIEESDLLLFLPGGIGTYFELFSSIEGKRCHEFNKPIIIFNQNGFFNKFIEIMNQNIQKGFSKQTDSLNYIISDNIQQIIYYIKKYNNPQEISDYKSSYEYGLVLLKDSLNEVNVPPYRAMLPYFEYPLSIIEKEVQESRKNKLDNDDFYRKKCDELTKMYERLLLTQLMCQSKFGTIEEKKRANEVLNALREQAKNNNLETELNEQKDNKDTENFEIGKVKKRKFTDFFKK